MGNRVLVAEDLKGYRGELMTQEKRTEAIGIIGGRIAETFVWCIFP